MGTRRFDRTFGEGFLDRVPDAPGVYFFHDRDGTLLYVGKARRLRRRLRQYRLAGRKKRDRTMRSVVARASSLSWEICATDLEASLHEVRAIQARRPQINVAGAYSHRYPFVGLGPRGGDPRELSFCFTTAPAECGEFRLFGAFRSREVVATGFFGLMRLLRHVGHASRPRRGDRRRSSLVYYRRLPADWAELWEPFFRGLSRTLLEEVALALLERPAARARAAEIQGDLDAAQRFWDEEARPLAEAIAGTAYPGYPVPQIERDPLFLRYRAGTVFMRANA